MTYLFKLAQRMAKIRFPVVIGVLGFLGCTKGEKTEFLAPNPNQNTPVLNSIRVEPQVTSVRVGSELQFAATGYTAAGAVMPVTVDWSAAGGIITPDGRYTGLLTGPFMVRAAVRDRAGMTDSARVVVWDNTTDLISVVVSPDSALLHVGDTLDLDAVMETAGGVQTGNANVTWSATGGSIDQLGRFTSPVVGQFVVAAVSAGGLLGQATVFAWSEAPTLTGIRLDPATLTTSPGRSTTFTATASWNDGSSSPADVYWSASGGTIVAGVYVAGSLPGTHRVIARAVSSDVADTSIVTIAAPTITRLVVSPSAPTLAPGATQQFTAQAEMNDGSFQNVPLVWLATGGSVSQTGLYTAPGTPGNHQVIVTNPASALADTAFVTVVSPVASLTAIIVNPSSATVPTGSSRQFSATGVWSDGSSTTPAVTWSATGGTISAGGLYTAGTAPGSFLVIARTAGGLGDTSAVAVTGPVLTSLQLSPATLSLQPGQTRQFVLTATWSDGATTIPPVTWTAAGGTITSGGLYTAGSVTGTYDVKATHQGGLVAGGLVTISPPPVTLTGVQLSPTSVALSPGGVQQFTAIGVFSNGTLGSVGVTWSATGGSVNSSGAYTAGSTPGTYRIIGRQTAGVLADTSAITITSSPTVIGLTIAPKPVSLQVNATQQFSLTALWSNGSTTVPPVVWTATGGSVSSSGLYTAGAVAGTFRVIATHQGGTRADTAAVTLTAVAPPPPTLTGLVVSPKPTSVQVNTTRQFNVGALWSDGSTTLPAITWTATGGSITSGGLYTAGATPGTFRAIASGGGKADTAVVTVTAASAPTLTTLTIGPKVISLAPGEHQFFAVSALWSDGSTTLPAITFSATGGTINSGGLYTAGSTAGTFRAIASGGGKADTAVITVTGPTTPTLTTLSIAPKPVTLGTGTTQQFTASALWSDGATTLPSLTWSATGGTINSSGLYTAGSTAGTFRAIATGGGKADTSVVTLTSATLTSLTISPKPTSLSSNGGTRQFSASALWSDGSTSLPSITWSATGGTINSSGLYTAGSTNGTFRAIATGGGKADTSVVTLTAPVVSSFVLTPASVSLAGGSIQQFSTATTWSDGVSRSVTVTYSATGGTVSVGGLYTAGVVAGTFSLIASCSCGAADTSAVVVTAAVPPTLTSLSISPKPTSLAVSTTRQFSASALWSNGTTTLPTTTWSATGGTINGSGLYTAGSATGPFRAIVSGGGKADTAVVTITVAGANNMYFNSAEAGCGTDPNVLLCDDFEDGTWYEKNCDQANNSGGLLQVDGWCGNIFSGNPSTSGVCGSVGVKSACVATTGVMSGSGNMADHDLASPVNELWLRFYLKPLPGYVWGAEKVITINSNPAGFGGITIGGIGAPFSDGGMRACPVYDCNVTGAVFYYSANMAPDLLLSAMAGRWVYIEIHLKLNTPGQKNGLYDLWMNDCGATGVCTGTPTLRSRYTTVEWQAPTDNKQIRSIWFENWSNPASSGERYWDQIKVSKAGPIGFMP